MIGVIRYLTSPFKSIRVAKFHLLSMLIQSLAVYPLLIQTMRTKELAKHLDFSCPYESYTGLYFPTIIALIILIISYKKEKWNWSEVFFPLIFFSLGFVYSYLTPYNQSKYATTMALLVIIQIFFVVYVVKSYIPSRLLIKCVYDGFCIIIILNAFISITYVLLHIDFIQNLFINFEGNIREGATYRRAYGTTNQPNRLGALCSLISMFFLSCYCFDFRRKLSICLFCVSCVTVLLSQSRSAFSALTVSSVFLFLLLQYKRNEMQVSRFIFYTFLLSFGYFLFSDLAIIQEMFFNSNVGEMQDARMGHYALGWMCVEDSNYMGVGINANTHYLAYAIKNYGFENWLYMHSIHSVHMGIMAELGLGGIILWAFYVMSRYARIVVTPIRKIESPIICYSFLGMLTIIVLHGFSDNVYMHYQYLLIACIFGAGYKISNSSDLNKLMK